MLSIFISASSSVLSREANPAHAGWVNTAQLPPKQKGHFDEVAFSVFWLPDLDSNQGPAD
jgi:hypothetical protein